MDTTKKYIFQAPLQLDVAIWLILGEWDMSKMFCTIKQKTWAHLLLSPHLYWEVEMMVKAAVALLDPRWIPRAEVGRASK